MRELMWVVIVLQELEMKLIDFTSYSRSKDQII